MFVGVALVVILAIGLKWPSATIWILALILLALLATKWESVKHVIYGG